MKCIVIDDELTALEILGQLCETHNDTNVLQLFSSPVEALKFINKTHVDLIFLDIHMPEFTGIDFLETLNKVNSKVVLTTSDPKFAIDSYKFDCVSDYILKPILPERFNAAVLKVKNQLSAQLSNQDYNFNNHLFVNINKRLIKIDTNHILFIVANGDYVNIITKTKNHIVHSTLKSIQSKLPNNVFFKSHRSYIINIKVIQEIEENTIIINKHLLPLSKNKKRLLLEKLNLL